MSWEKAQEAIEIKIVKLLEKKAEELDLIISIRDGLVDLRTLVKHLEMEEGKQNEQLEKLNRSLEMLTDRFGRL